MVRELSDNFKKATNAQETTEVYIVLVTISHPSFTEDLRIASDPFEDLPDAGVKGVISRGEEYLFLPFSLNLPAQDDTGVARASITIDNIDRRIVSSIRQATSAVNITIEIVLASDVNTPEITVLDFKLERVTYDALTVSGDISVEYYDTEPFPQGRFTPSKWPGIF